MERTTEQSIRKVLFSIGAEIDESVRTIIFAEIGNISVLIGSVLGSPNPSQYFYDAFHRPIRRRRKECMSVTDREIAVICRRIVSKLDRELKLSA